MGVFRQFEEQAVQLLVEPALGSEQTKRLIAEATLVSYEYTGAGYFLTVKHPLLPEKRSSLTVPYVTGRSGAIEGGYIAFIEKGELMLECYSAGAENVPESFRDQNVVISAI